MGNQTLGRSFSVWQIIVMPTLLTAYQLSHAVSPDIEITDHKRDESSQSEASVRSDRSNQRESSTRSNSSTHRDLPNLSELSIHSDRLIHGDSSTQNEHSNDSKNPDLAASKAYQKAVEGYNKASEYYKGRVLKIDRQTTPEERAKLYKQSVKNFAALENIAVDALVKSQTALTDHEAKRSVATDPGVIHFHTVRIERHQRDVRNLTGLVANSRLKTESQTRRLNETLKKNASRQ